MFATGDLIATHVLDEEGRNWISLGKIRTDDKEYDWHLVSDPVAELPAQVQVQRIKKTGLDALRSLIDEKVRDS